MNFPELLSWESLIDFPSTFAVKTRLGGRHYYYRCPELLKRLIMYDKELVNKEKESALHIGEVQARGQYVVGPGSSFHLTDKGGKGVQPLYYRDGQQVKPIIQRWEVLEDVPIADISKDLLLEILSVFDFSARAIPADQSKAMYPAAVERREPRSLRSTPITGNSSRSKI